MFDVLMKIFGKSEKKSGEIAKERLKLVLIQDRASVSPEVMDKLKNEILNVILKYMDVNKSGVEITLANDSDSVALVANIPVESVHHKPK